MKKIVLITKHPAYALLQSLLVCALLMGSSTFTVEKSATFQGPLLQNKELGPLFNMHSDTYILSLPRYEDKNALVLSFSVKGASADKGYGLFINGHELHAVRSRDDWAEMSIPMSHSYTQNSNNFLTVIAPQENINWGMKNIQINSMKISLEDLAHKYYIEATTNIRLNPKNAQQRFVSLAIMSKAVSIMERSEAPFKTALMKSYDSLKTRCEEDIKFHIMSAKKALYLQKNDVAEKHLKWIIHSLNDPTNKRYQAAKALLYSIAGGE